MALSGRQYAIAAGPYEATIAEVGASLRSLRAGGADVTVPYGEDVVAPRGSGAVLVPWPNRLRGGHYEFDGQSLQVPITEQELNNALHGLARWVRWSVVRHEPAAVALAVDLVPQTGWPFEVAVEVTYRLDPQHGLVVTVRAHNHGTGRAPFGAGFHPYLGLYGATVDDVTLHLPATRRIVTDDAQIPIGVQPVAGTAHDFTSPRRINHLRMDDGFTGLATAGGRGAVDLSTPHGGTRLWFDASFGYLQVFTVDELITTGRPAIAVEPMTCAANAFNSGDGLIVLAPGSTWSGSWGLQSQSQLPRSSS